ncbi:MAG: tyrosine--tRNA ligase [Patescibacteria group bacterium]|nr:tyrosine--tRNA ligase [Patescibacteria group bacterium]
MSKIITDEPPLDGLASPRSNVASKNMKIETSEEKIEEVLDRGVEQVFPDRESLKKKLMSGERIKLYCGYDPTAPALHIGNATTMNKLSQFQALGHEVIFLVGDFTCTIGDPTDKLAMRKKMTREEVLKNAEDYQRQAGGYLKFDGENPAKFMYNSEWNDKLTFKELIELSSNFTVQQMIQRDMFQQRLKDEKPIYLHEFLYPLTQGYDSVAMNVDLEVGGNDQMFNMLAGRTLQKVVNDKEKFVLTLKLLADETGKKIGKSEGNAVFLDQEPEDMYGAVMSWTDGTIAIGFEMVTGVPMTEVVEIRKALENEKNNPRDLKMRLAFEMVKINHGEEAAQKAQEDFISKFQKGDVPENVQVIVATIGATLVATIVEGKLAESNGDAKRKLKQGGVEIDGQKILDVNAEITRDMNGKVLKVGKKDFRKLRITN